MTTGAVDLTYIRLRHGDFSRVTNRDEVIEFVSKLPHDVVSRYLSLLLGKDTIANGYEYVYFIPTVDHTANDIKHLVEELLLDYYSKE